MVHNFNNIENNFNPSLQDAIAEDKRTHGSMLVPIIAGSDKTTVSVATGHQEYHPVYSSPGNLTNIARRSHGNAVLPIAFLPIPKSELFNYSSNLFHMKIYFSKQTSKEATRISTICAASVSHVPCANFCTSSACND